MAPDLLPLLVELSSYDRDRTHKGIVEYCQSILEVHNFSPAQLESRLQAGQAAFYLDGLDEIFDRPAQKSVIDEIVTLCASYPQAQIVVTTRKVGYEPEHLRNAGFVHATLEEFDATQILKFLDFWHGAAENDVALRNRLRKRIADAIGQSRAIRELAGNPLLLTMMAILNRNQELPRDRVKLYEQASQVLLHEWDWSRALLAADAEKVERQEKERLLRNLAGEMQQVEGGLAGNLIERGRLVKVFRSFLNELGFVDAYSMSIALVQQLTERNFILAYAGADRFCFVHRTFLEYFCASWFVERMGLLEGSDGYLSFAGLREEVFGRHWKDETWHEVLRLIAGIVHETKAGELIRFLMAQDGRNQKLANLMLAAGCLSEVRSRGAIQPTMQVLWKRFTDQAIRFDPLYYYESYDEFDECGPTRQGAVRSMALAWKDEDTRAWLRSAATQDPDWIIRQVAVQELARGWKDDPGTLPLLQDRARNDYDSDVRRAAVQELARSWKDAPGTLPLLQDRACKDKSGGVRGVAVRELVRGWKDNPGTLPWLQDLTRNDDDSDVRVVAVQELARGWKDDPGTLPLLQDHARNDDDSDVRVAAVRELVCGWKDDSGTLPWLQDRARNDKSGSVRRVAVQELARGWKDAPGTLPWLQDRACNDYDSDVRVVAVQELARGWKDAPDTLPWLQNRARNDKSGSVRGVAVQELARGWKDAPGTLPLLQDRARKDKSGSIRGVAVRELVHGWKDDPDTLPLLQDRTRNDDDSDVRVAAVQELARGWRDDPSTLPRLQDHACKDISGSVRQAAVQELVRGWRDAPGTLPLLQDRARKDKLGSVRQAAVQELARGWKDAPGTLPLLQDRARNDDDSDVPGGSRAGAGTRLEGRSRHTAAAARPRLQR